MSSLLTLGGRKKRLGVISCKSLSGASYYSHFVCLRVGSGIVDILFWNVQKFYKKKRILNQIYQFLVFLQFWYITI